MVDSIAPFAYPLYVMANPVGSSFNTPLLMRLPKGLDARGDIDQLVQNIDYTPTFLDMAGIEVPEDMHGVSLLPLLRGETPESWRDALYFHYYEYPAEHAVKRHYGVRTDRYKLIHFYNDIDCRELYDLHEDPHEMNNLYGKPGTEEITVQMKNGSGNFRNNITIRYWKLIRCDSHNGNDAVS